MLGVATSGATLFRSIGGSLGTAVLGAIFTSRLTSELARLPAARRRAPGWLDPGALERLPAAIRDAYIGAFTDALRPRLPRRGGRRARRVPAVLADRGAAAAQDGRDRRRRRGVRRPRSTPTRCASSRARSARGRPRADAARSSSDTVPRAGVDLVARAPSWGCCAWARADDPTLDELAALPARRRERGSSARSASCASGGLLDGERADRRRAARLRERLVAARTDGLRGAHRRLGAGPEPRARPAAAAAGSGARGAGVGVASPHPEEGVVVVGKMPTLAAKSRRAVRRAGGRHRRGLRPRRVARLGRSVLPARGQRRLRRRATTSLDLELRAGARPAQRARRRVRRGDAEPVQFDLDLRDFYAVSRVSVNQRPASFTPDRQELDDHPRAGCGRGRGFVVVVAVRRHPEPVIDPDGSLEGWIPTDDGAFVAASPGRARLVPRQRHPTRQGDVRLQGHRAGREPAMGNGGLVGRDDQRRTATWRWRGPSRWRPISPPVTVGTFETRFTDAGRAPGLRRRSTRA